MDTCRHCGTPRDPGAADAIAWARDRDLDGREHWMCPACARRYARDIEARLPQELWA
jgi:hypothetical protein